GPAPVSVPNVVGLSQAAATTAITNAGLILGTVTTASSNTVPAGNVISESPVSGTLVNRGSSVSLVVSSGAAPTVVSFKVLFGGQSYNVTGSTRTRLPWQITGIQVVFSKPITTGGVASLSGVIVTGFGGLGTTTLNWSINPVPQGNLAVALSGSGPNALKDAAGNGLGGGAGFAQALKVLWGDFNDDGVVSAGDLIGVNNATVSPYNIFADMNGDGTVSVSDVQIVRARVGTSLP
ncbi:MAG: PASTA domain-containing protein, partial [Acidipila sp.]|nr:PASTA domain-containing protein [Acidipila sp.]